MLYDISVKLMGDINVPRDPQAILDRVEDDLYVAEDAIVKARDSKAIAALGAIRCDDDCIFDCNVSATLLKGRDGGNREGRSNY